MSRDQCCSVEEDADDVGAAADLSVQLFLGVVGPDLPPGRFRERGERQNVDPELVEVVGDGWQFVG
jgi:hypothetical protein